MFLEDKDLLMKDWLMKHAYELRDALMIDSSLKPYNQKSAQEYYIASILDELIRYGTTLIRWEDDFKDGFDEGIEATHLGNLIVQAINNELNMYYRKLLEAFIDLVLWDKYASEESFKFFYLLKEYQVLKYDILDMKDFYDIEISDLGQEFDVVKNMVQTTYSNINESDCFYLKRNRRKDNINGTMIWTDFVSIKNKLKQALSSATDVEKVLLGLTYNQYSKSSEKIHLISDSKRFDSEGLTGLISITLIMCVQILSKCASILEVSDFDEYEKLDASLNRLNETKNWYSPILEDIYDIDDYVYISKENIYRITSTKVSQYGYRSYELLTLGTMTKVWLPAHYIRRIQPRQALLEMIFDKTPGFKEVYDAESDEDFKLASLDDLMKFLWEIALKKRFFK